jgi:hypothetical protein
VFDFGVYPSKQRLSVNDMVGSAVAIPETACMAMP